MKLRTVLIAGTMLGVVALRAIAEEPANTNRPPRSTREHRFLVIVENSKLMGKRSEGVAHTVLDFIGSGMKGQVRRGDTLGLWLFNEELITGKFPLQKWGADNQQKVATSIVEFLDKPKFEKQGKPEKMLPSLSRVITNSQLITVLLISSGDAEVHGTGDDNEINAVYKQWREQQQRKKMPCVTLLRGKNGALTDVRVSPAPWPVEVPPLPPEPIVQAKPAAPAKQPVTILPPLIVSGKKPEVLPSPKPTEGVRALLSRIDGGSSLSDEDRMSKTPKITREIFFRQVGEWPVQDDLERCNCKEAGQPGHFQCGWNDETNLPVFLSPRRTEESK